MRKLNGLYYMNARYYNPEMGRFFSEDPAGLGGGDFTLYSYAGNNPVVFVDPSGLCASNSGNTSQQIASYLYSASDAVKSASTTMGLIAGSGAVLTLIVIVLIVIIHIAELFIIKIYVYHHTLSK